MLTIILRRTTLRPRRRCFNLTEIKPPQHLMRVIKATASTTIEHRFKVINNFSEIITRTRRSFDRNQHLWSNANESLLGILMSMRLVQAGDPEIRFNQHLVVEPLLLLPPENNVSEIMPAAHAGDSCLDSTTEHVYKKKVTTPKGCHSQSTT